MMAEKEETSADKCPECGVAMRHTLGADDDGNVHYGWHRTASPECNQLAALQVERDGLKEQLERKKPSAGHWTWGPDVERSVRELWDILGDAQPPERAVL
ncbi:MAG: hypothetical protein KAT58_13125, partial [candidate division Zixibacteria bacterium]|nr:hypothetical protein [candidate division Zixibacteria bacterium]